jgi:hypothetical protein
MTLFNTLLALTNFRSPFLRTLVPSIGLAYAIQAGVAVPSILYQTERYYDLSGSLTYLSCTALSLYLPTLRARAAAESVSAGTAALPAFPSLLASLASKGGVQAWNWRQVALSAAVAIWATRRTSKQPLIRLTTHKTNSRHLSLLAHHCRRRPRLPLR